MFSGGQAFTGANWQTLGSTLNQVTQENSGNMWNGSSVNTFFATHDQSVATYTNAASLLATS